MLNLKEMIRKNDFSDLINSTQEERTESGGNFYLYMQLVDYLHFDFIRDVVIETFKHDVTILEDLRKQLKETKRESLSGLVAEDPLNNIFIFEK